MTELFPLRTDLLLFLSTSERFHKVVDSVFLSTSERLHTLGSVFLSASERIHELVGSEDLHDFIHGRHWQHSETPDKKSTVAFFFKHFNTFSHQTCHNEHYFSSTSHNKYFTLFLSHQILVTLFHSRKFISFVWSSLKFFSLLPKGP